MTPAPSPSWYDVLGVPVDATPDEIRAAWRAQIADLDPTDRRFAVLNQAAEVLLDPERRAAYDATAVEPVETPEAGTPAAETPEAKTSESATTVARPRSVAVVPGWLLAGVAAIALVLVVATAVVWSREPSADSVESNARAAQAAAERAVEPILSYDATDLDGSRAAATPYLTSGYREEYDKLFDGIIAANAPATGTVLTADLLRSGIVRTGSDRVQVFALVNQSRTNKKFKEPQIYKNWVTITMQKVDGTWLVDSLDT